MAYWDYDWLCDPRYLFAPPTILLLEERICRALGGAGLGGGFQPSYIEQIFLIK